MVYESDFYTTRRPYRATPSLSTYTVSSLPSRQVRILPGLGKVHVVHTYDRIVPYVGHKRLSVVTSPPIVVRVRPSVLYKEYDRIERKMRPITYYSPTSSFLNSDSAVAFDDETRFIKAQTQSLLRRCHTTVPRVERSWSPIKTVVRYDDTPARWSNDNYIYRMLVQSANNPKVQYTTYYTEPLRRYIGQGHLAAVSYIGDKGHPRRSHIRVYEDPVKNDIQLLSYYINRFRDQKALKEPSKVPLDPNRPTRVFNIHKPLEDNTAREIAELREARAQRWAKIHEVSDEPIKEDPVKVSQRKKEEARAIAEEQAKKAAQAKKEEAARRAELARQEELAAQAAAERAADLERKAEQAKQDELAKQAELEKAKKDEEERARLDEERKAAEAAKAEEERQQLLRLEEIARQAEAEKEAELARQAEELAELARQEAELAEQARLEEEKREQERKEAEAAELARQEAELAELERQEQELAEAARVEAERAEKASKAAEIAEFLRQKAELDALEAEARAMLEPVTEPARSEEEEAPAEGGEADQEPEEHIPDEEPAAETEPADESTAAEPTAAEESEAAQDPVVEEPVTPEVDLNIETSAEPEVADEEEEEE